MLNKSELRGAIAKGYCSIQNEDKEVDSELLEDISNEVINYLTDEFDSFIEEYEIEINIREKSSNFDDLKDEINIIKNKILTLKDLKQLLIED